MSRVYVQFNSQPQTYPDLLASTSFAITCFCPLVPAPPGGRLPALPVRTGVGGPPRGGPCWVAAVAGKRAHLALGPLASSPRKTVYARALGNPFAHPGPVPQFPPRARSWSFQQDTPVSGPDLAPGLGGVQTGRPAPSRPRELLAPGPQGRGAGRGWDPGRSPRGGPAPGGARRRARPARGAEGGGGGGGGGGDAARLPLPRLLLLPRRPGPWRLRGGGSSPSRARSPAAAPWSPSERGARPVRLRTWRRRRPGLPPSAAAAAAGRSRASARPPAAGRWARAGDNGLSGRLGWPCGQVRRAAAEATLQVGASWQRRGAPPPPAAPASGAARALCPACLAFLGTPGPVLRVPGRRVGVRAPPTLPGAARRVLTRSGPEARSSARFPARPPGEAVRAPVGTPALGGAGGTERGIRPGGARPPCVVELFPSLFPRPRGRPASSGN